MTSCFECQYSQIVWYQDTDLPEPVAALVSAHIDDCVVCRSVVVGEQVVTRLVQQVAVEQAPAELRMRIKAQIVASNYRSR